MRNLYLTLSLILCLHLAAFSQSDSAHITAIASKLQKLSTTRPVEKVYLAFNKPAYNIGDTIWFKGYVTVGEHHQPSALSGILYAELIDGKDKIIKSLRLKNDNGISQGDFVLDDKLAPGDYRIRGYTNWMRNAGPDYFFNKTISVGNIKTSAVFITAGIDVPAGGLVNARLAYTDKFGRPFDHKAVTYEVKADTTTLYKGSGITDDKGNLTFAFSDKAANGQKRVNVINHIKLVSGVTIDKTIPVSLQKETIDIQFFPEGGQLVNGVRSKVAFKAIGVNGLGAEVKGTILDNENNEAAYFNSQHAGMGIFAITPEAGKTYTAKITLSDNSIITAKLPIAAEKGFVLAVNNNSTDSTKLNVRIATNAATLQEKQNTTFYLIGQSGGTVYYTTLGKLGNASFTASVPKNKFPTGIAQFTLFSADNEPLNERVVFIQNNTDLLNLDLKTEKIKYTPKEKVSMAFNAKDNNNKPALGSFSLSVFNEDRLTANENAESTILTNILLTSDLKGYIEEPNYYFNDPTDQSKTDLDILMLTQGYRRFEWKEIMADNYPKIVYQPERSLSISGNLTNSAGKPVIKGKLKVLALINKTVIDTTTDEQGNFMLTNVDIPDSAKLVIEATKANDGRNVNITLDNSHTVPVVFKSNIADASENSTPPFLRIMSNATMDQKADTAQLAANIKANTILKGNDLKAVDINAKKINEPTIYNNYGSVVQFNLNMAQARNYNSAYEAVEYRIPGVTYKGKLFYERKPIGSFIINGLLDSIERLKIIDPADVESISLIGKTATSLPIISLTTKSFAGTDTIKLKNAITTDNSKMLEDVNIKAHTPDKPDQSNLWGATRPLLIVSGKTLEDYTDIVHGLMVKAVEIHYKNGKIYDAIPPAKKAGIPGQPYPIPIPVVIDGVLMDNSLNLDDVITANLVENVKIVQGFGFKSTYGIDSRDPNDKVIIITTKRFAGTDIDMVGDTIKNGLKQVNLKEVNVKGRKNAGTEIAPWMETVMRSANLNGPGHANMVFSGKQLENCPDLVGCLLNRIPGIQHPQDPTMLDYYQLERHGTQSISHPVFIKYMLDGLLVPGDQLNNVSVNDVETVEILNSSSYLNVYGTEASGGLIIVTTKIGSTDNDNAIAFKSVPGVIYTRFNGFYKAKEFYTPKYTATNLNATDSRTAVYWNPNIVTDATGTFPVEYFNSDVKGTYRAVVEGIDNDGNIGRFVYRYRVE